MTGVITPSSIAIFVKRDGKNTLANTFEETLTIENQMLNISNKYSTEENKTSLMIKKNIATKTIEDKKYSFDIEGLQRFIKHD
jgi:hypothetical protein